MTYDPIELESDEQLEKWHDRFSLDNCPNHEITLPDVPYSYHEILREILRREALEDISHAA